MKKISSILWCICGLLAVSGHFQAQNVFVAGGNGNYGFSGDGGAAANAQFGMPHGVAVDPFGNIFVADRDNHRIRKINSAGIISTFAGNGIAGYSGDGGMAVNAQIDSPWDVACDVSGNVYIADYVNLRIRKINTAGIITTVAGGNVITGPDWGDGSPAVNAIVMYPGGIDVDASGNLYICEYGGKSDVRKVNTAGIITTIAGANSYSYSGDGGNAVNAELNGPLSVAFDASGNCYIADHGNNRIRKINAAGIISTFAGDGNAASGGDGGPAINAQINAPWGVVADASGNILISERNRIRSVNSTGIISTFAGTGVPGFNGNGVPANIAQFSFPGGMSIDAYGNLFIAELGNNRVRQICSVDCITDISIIPKQDYQTVLFPNPNHGTINLKIESWNTGDKLIVLNTLGQPVLQQEIMADLTTIVSSDLTKGIYYYTINRNNFRAATGKFIIE